MTMGDDIHMPRRRSPGPRKMPVAGVRGLADLLAALRGLTPEERESLGFATEADLERLWGDVSVRLNAMEQRLAGIERRLAMLEARPMPPDLSDVYARLAALETRDSGVIARAVAQEADFGMNDADLDPMTWVSIERARTALTTLVRREHQDLTASRQRILERVTLLSRTMPRSQEDEAELRQHEERARRLGDLDARLGAKLDEIAGLDDLEAAQDYDVKGGWE